MSSSQGIWRNHTGQTDGHTGRQTLFSSHPMKSLGDKIAGENTRERAEKNTFSHLKQRITIIPIITH